MINRLPYLSLGVTFKKNIINDPFCFPPSHQSTIQVWYRFYSKSSVPSFQYQFLPFEWDSIFSDLGYALVLIIPPHSLSWVLWATVMI